jgi:hypothetical protein
LGIGALILRHDTPLSPFQFGGHQQHGIRPGTVLPDGEGVTPSTPLAFTSAFPKRQVQLGIRFVF